MNTAGTSATVGDFVLTPFGDENITPIVDLFLPQGVGITDAAWNNPGKGRELANAQYEQGADVIFQAAGNSGLGVFDAAEAYDRFAIGVDANQNWVKPGHVLTSMLKRIDNAVYSIVKDEVEDKFKGGVHVYGLENDGVGYAIDDYNRHLVPPLR